MDYFSSEVHFFTKPAHFSNQVVTLFISYDPTRERKGISCMYCKKFLYREDGRVIAMTDTEVNLGDEYNTKELRCSGCKTLYIIAQKIKPEQVMI